MQWLNDLSIKYKLLLGFAIVVTLIIPIGIFCIYNTQHIKQSFNDIVNSTFPRIQALSEMKNIATKIQLLTMTCKTTGSKELEENKNVECKNELLANIEKINWLARQYQQHLTNKQSSSLDIKELSSLQDDIIFSALHLIQLKEKNNASQLHETEIKLVKAQNTLANYIENSITNESINLEKTQKMTHNEISNIFNVTLLGICLTISIAIILSYLLTRLISRPIIRLNDFSKTISTHNINKQFVITSNDEVGQLALSINEMITKLLEAHQQLIVTARQAGMAEIATSVLHNIGNVLNSINVSASLLLETLSKTKFKNFSKAAGLLEQNLDNLTTFLTTDEQGKHLPTYLIKLAKHVDTEQVTLFNEIELLIKHIKHIKDIIASQQSLSGRSELMAPTLLTEVINESLLLTGDSFDKAGIIIERNYAESPPIITDKLKLQQIFINLLRNSKDALLASSILNKRIIITTLENNNGFVYIHFSDNGIGIDEQFISKIFTFGFTTKKDGHGFGLHSAVLAAKELGGSLTVNSEGLGKGCTFTLKLPTQPGIEGKTNEQ